MNSLSSAICILAIVPWHSTVCLWNGCTAVSPAPPEYATEQDYHPDADEDNRTNDAKTPVG